ncbi:MAG: hypothetical protein V3T94_05055 [Thermoplasmata archaeon]
MTSAESSATLGFVNRVEEMNRILDALKAASAGEGQLWKAKGDREKAGETLDTALGIFEDLELEYLAGIVRDAAQGL